MIGIMLFVIFGLVIFLLPFAMIYTMVTDSRIESTKILDTVGKKVSFQITYKGGKTKIETTKIGSARYDKLRVMCK